MALTPEQIAEWRSKLMTVRSSLEQELSSSEEAARPVDLGQPIGRLTRIDALQQQQMALAHLDRIRNRMLAIGGALGRLDDGTFGECLRCGEDIELRRLEARPETFFCLICQQSQG